MGLVDAVQAGPCEGTSYNNCPECVSLQRVGVKTKQKQRENKSELLEKNYRNPPRLFLEASNVYLHKYIYTHMYKFIK